MSSNNDEEAAIKNRQQQQQQENLADAAGCISCTQDLLCQWIPALDIGSDLVIVVLSIWEFSFMDETMFFAGFAAFWASQIVRLCHESMFTTCCYEMWQSVGFLFLSETYQGQNNSCCNWICRLIGSIILGPIYFVIAVIFLMVAVTFGALSVFLHALVLIFFIPDLIISLAYNIEFRQQNNCTMVLLSGWLLTMRPGWGEHFTSKGFLRRYYHLCVSLICGGRWIVTSYWKWARVHRRQDYTNDLSSGYCQLSHVLAVCEEVLENAGGCLMSISILMSDWHDSSDGGIFNNRTLAIFQLTMSAISALYETGTILGLFAKHSRTRQT